ncbi:hypothetical protein [Actinomadura montaniterrae]|uniref:Uncharacterized protein n=1 Tax=Actinomadura montaniterrae TaxID=1803903 RepID=A0A6L3VYB4_9ACTN|nr:hypothetical protein [Actinomadura montaniterrae]KAB2376977.1 hypothetical protein F9B16_24385 [Actinomadura montaniterrae]
MSTADESTDLPPLPRPVWEPIDALHAALRRRTPVMAAAIVRELISGANGAEEARCLVVTYRGQGPWRIAPDPVAEVFRWLDGPRGGMPLGLLDGIDACVEGVAEVMAVTPSPPPPTRNAPDGA